MNTNTSGANPVRAIHVTRQDDGGHTMLQQQLTLAAYWRRVRPGGLFIIEDLHTSFSGSKTVTSLYNFVKILRIVTLVPE